MVDIMAPVVDPGANALILENMVQCTGIFDGLFFPGAQTDTDDDGAFTIAIQVPGIREPRQVAYR